jgi:prepilin-type N-terminal cleavage/methylation domain-containing protein
MKIKAFTLIELLVVIVIIGILAALSVPQLSKYTDQAGDAWRQTVIKNVTKIVLADEFISLDGVNFADLDADTTYVGTDDPVTIADLQSRLNNQDYILATENQEGCFLYGYTASVTNHDDMLMIVGKESESGAGEAGFIFDGTDQAKVQAKNITAISCAPGSEGVTGGTWTDYQWLNFIP